MRTSAPMLCVLFLALGCDRVLGIEQLPHASIVDAGDARVPTVCETCEDKCAPERGTCELDPVCSSTWQCVSACPLDDVMCRKKCEDTNPGWAKNHAYLAFDRCRRENCLDKCYGTGGLLEAIDGDCRCLDRECAKQVVACLQSGVSDLTAQAGACERHLTCVAANPNPDTFVICDAMEGGADEWNGLARCSRESPCSVSGKSCPIPTGEIACTGKFAYGQPTGSTSTQRLTFQVTDWITQPIANAQATACVKGACSPCVPVPNAGGTGVTDAKGNVTLTVPMVPNDYSGCVQVTSPAGQSFLTTLIFTGRQVHTDEKLLGTVLWESGMIEIFGALTDPPVSPDFAGRGMLFGTVHDCLWWHPTGAFVSIDGADSSTKVIYLGSGGVATNQELGTTNLGAFGIFNVTPGKHIVTVTMGGTTISRVEVEAAAGKVTDVNTFPMSVGGS